MSRPILVTGSHRSGTTWVGRMLCQSGEAGYLHEPFNPNRSPGWFREPLPYWFMHITHENEDAYAASVQDMIDFRYPVVAALARSRSVKQVVRQFPEITRSVAYRIKGVRPLVKDPMALFSSEWLADRFNMDVVVMIRHPAAFVSSIKRLNWGFDYERNWLAQEPLMRDLLADFADQLSGYRGEVDLVGEGIVLWNALYDVVSRYRQRRPGWSFVKYEDLADEPAGGFRALYEQLGLRWDAQVEERIGSYARAGNPSEVAPWRRRAIRRDSRAAKATWRHRLTAQEIERVRAGTAEVATRFYSDADWDDEVTT